LSELSELSSEPSSELSELALGSVGFLGSSSPHSGSGSTILRISGSTTSDFFPQDSFSELDDDSDSLLDSSVLAY